MATFTGRLPSATYKNILNIDNSNAGIDGTLRTMQDGEGTASVVQFSSTGVNILSGFSYNSFALSFAGAFSTSGAYNITLTATNTTSITLPTTGTVSTLAGSETLTNKTLTSPTINGATIGTSTYNGMTISSTNGTFVLANKTFTVNNQLTLSGTDGSTITLGTGGTVLYSGGALGTPSSGTLSSCTAYPVAQLTGTGTGVLTALAIAVGSVGGPITNGGAGGTPSSISLGNGTGLPESGITGTAWTDFSGSIGYTGFSGTPTTTVAKWKQIGKVVHINIIMTGTSNTTAFTITSLPATCATTIYFNVADATNNSAAAGTACAGTISGSSTTATLMVSGNAAGWTASGTKAAKLSFFYEAS